MFILFIVINLIASVHIDFYVNYIECMSMLFVGAFVHTCLNSDHQFVAYEADSRNLNAIPAPLCALFALCLRVQIPTQCTIVEEDENHVRKMAKNICLSM